MADPVRAGAEDRPYKCPFKTAAQNPPFKLDEGYSDDTRSQSGSDTVMPLRPELQMDESMDEGVPQLPSWVLDLSEAERSEFAYAILRSLQTSRIAAIVDRLNPLLHIDPVHRLPAEIVFEIFGYLEPNNLLRASTLSKSWRYRALDGRLWRKLFGTEGWASNIRQVRKFEEDERTKATSRIRRAEEEDDDMGSSKSRKRRVHETGLFGDGTMSNAGSSTSDATRMPGWAEQHGPVEADDTPMVESPDLMQDVVPEIPIRTQSSGMDTLMSPVSERSFDNLQPPVKPPLVLRLEGTPKVNWQFLFKQKRRLEENWNAGRFLNFQLPHPNHPEEAHKECVYTIQFSGNHLVSGSRDQTIRVWNLETQRLMLLPLTGHSASVLCLQFDDRPEHDIIVSGGSDCHVLVWRFSTGQMIKKLEKAHSESVLNLRFDERYLITCSKDKTIKVWTRQAILPTDDAYPTSTTASGTSKFPPYIINMSNELERQALHTTPLAEYNLLMTLTGHSAAVNAIQIYDNQIVSASGDRQVKIWDVHTGRCIKTVPGHLKGIACVQFDGRRIVSGSSDDTVRIFDRATGAEVACLRGHSNLVRTVQARFGDRPGNEEDLEAEARAVDRDYFAARANDASIGTRRLTRDERRNRNAGSRNPQDIFAIGAKLPPGGGGSRWARIVSGSYDETIIIWRQNSEGRWVVAHQLQQWEAVFHAGGRPRNGINPPNDHRHLHLNGAAQGPGQAGPPNNQAQGQAPPVVVAQALVNQAQAQLAQAQATVTQAQNIVGPQPVLPGSTTTTSMTATAGPSTAPQPQQQQLQQPLTEATPPAPTALVQAPQPQPPAQVQAQANPAPHHHHHHHHHHANPNHHHHHPAAGGGQGGGANGSNSRVFKLQFDSRRIICCSQDPVIVGWDFANRDSEIVQASRFFGDDL
ncbi:WD40 repeat-like protein [Aulographum hederae CBS 113979]|uniref:WD40 repeat-like protein n=1 Tax=Aulographum hederae CBS 113979 TaxID=1176131 RepID=A0A6G1GTW5_9PEZI|nr:WD40 repeat-like protein [Aulographum hederae CBS 113979]